MHDFQCAVPDDMKYAVLSEKTRLLKDDDKEAREVCEFWEELKEEGRKEGRIEAEKRLAEAKTQAAEAKTQAAEAKTQAAEAKTQAAEAKAQTAEAKAKNAALKKAFRMIMDGLSAEKIVEYTDLPRDEVDELIAIAAH